MADDDTLCLPSLMGLEAVESAEAESPRSAMDTATTNIYVGTEVATADWSGVEERHCSL